MLSRTWRDELSISSEGGRIVPAADMTRVAERCRATLEDFVRCDPVPCVLADVNNLPNISIKTLDFLKQWISRCWHSVLTP